MVGILGFDSDVICIGGFMMDYKVLKFAQPSPSQPTVHEGRTQKKID